MADVWGEYRRACFPPADLAEPVESDVLDRIVENGSRRIDLKPEPLPPVVPELRRKYPGMSDEERLLRFSFAGTQVDDMRATGPTLTEYRFETPLARLMSELAKRRKFKLVHVEKDDTLVHLVG